MFLKAYMFVGVIVSILFGATYSIGRLPKSVFRNKQKRIVSGSEKRKYRPNKMSDENITMGSTPETTKFQHSWVLWYFDPRNKDWSLSNYKKVADLSTPQQLWTIVSSIPKEAWECGYFFFKRQGFRPIWEVPENENGGSWSKKVKTADIVDIAIELMVYSVSSKDGLLVTRPETLVGFSTSPKGEFNVVKIWNTTSSVSNAKNTLNHAMEKFPITEEVVYTAHKSRR